MALGIPDGSDAGPWYRSSAPAALLVASGLFVVVTVAHIVANGTGEAIDILYALPVALLAMSFGLRGGLIGAAIGISLFAVVELVDGVGDIDATGWMSRAAGLFLLGVLLGRATDQIEAGRLRSMAAADERQRLEERARRQSEGLEISDSILQHLAVAKWMVEAGDNEAAIVVLTSTMATGERMVAELLPMKRSGSKAEHMTDDSIRGP
jgi:glucose-6-phosphate-specific signal transduction histidine kinase